MKTRVSLKYFLSYCDLNFFFCFSNKNFREKVAKQKHLTWGHAETFIAIAQKLFPCPLSLSQICQIRS